MGTIQIKKVEKKVVTGKVGQDRQKVKKTYGKIIYRGTLGLADMAEHIMKHGTVYTEDVVLGVITKLKNCMQEMLADGYKVKLDGIGTLYPVLTSSGVADAKDFSAQENITRVGISFLADQSKKSQYKASAMKQGTILSTKLYSELTGEDENPSAGSGQASGSGSGSGEGSGSGSGTGSITTGVAAPTIGGEAAFTTSTQVTMSGPDGAEIRYTTDGSTPTASSTLYTEAITVSSSVTLKAIAIKDGQSSEVTTKQFVKSDGGADDPSGFEGA
jgi:predicted histone-like DNA-binding protein